MTYSLGKTLPSASIFDYWSPAESVQRILCGAVVDKMKVMVNSDFHEFHFAGPAQDLIDNVSFAAGQGEADRIPGRTGVRIASITRLCLATWGRCGSVSLRNGFIHLRLRNCRSTTVSTSEIGSSGRALSDASRRAVRNVNVDFELYGSDQESTTALYAAAKQRSPISAMFQLGEQSGQLFGAYMKSVVPETPQFDDAETRVRWRFSGCRAQGSADDELVIAFG